MNKLNMKKVLAILATGVFTYQAKAQSYCETIFPLDSIDKDIFINDIVQAPGNQGAYFIGTVGWNNIAIDNHKTILGNLDNDGNKNWMTEIDLIPEIPNQIEFEKDPSILVSAFNPNQLIVTKNGLKFGGTGGLFSITIVNSNTGLPIISKYYEGVDVYKIFEGSQGKLNLFGNRGGELCIIQLNADLTLNQAYKLGYALKVNDVIKTSNDYIICGVNNYGSSAKQVLISLSSTLTVNWAKYVDISDHYALGRVAETTSGKIITTFSKGIGANEKIEVNRFNQQGNLLNTMLISNPNHGVRPMDVHIRNNATLIAGYTSITHDRGVVIAITSSNQVVAKQTDYPSRFEAITDNSNGDITVVGSKKPPYETYRKPFIVEMDNAGSSCCLIDYDVDVLYLSQLTVDYAPYSSLQPITFNETNWSAPTTDFGQVNVECSSTQPRYTSVESKENTEFSIYPNPANNELKVVSNEFSEGTTYKLYDMKGKLVESIVPTTKQTTINISHLPTGIYQLNILLKDKIITKKVSVSK